VLSVGLSESPYKLLSDVDVHTKHDFQHVNTIDCNNPCRTLTTVYFDNEDVLAAAFLTVITVGLLTLYALCANSDFTVLLPIMLVASLMLLVVSILMFFMPNKTLQLVYCYLGVLVFAIYIVVDT
jgi:FtsH-binding integral membrane protein